MSSREPIVRSVPVALRAPLLLLAASLIVAGAGPAEEGGWHREGAYFSIELPSGLKRSPAVREYGEAFGVEWQGDRLKVRLRHLYWGWEQDPTRPASNRDQVDGRPARTWSARESGDLPFCVAVEVRDSTKAPFWRIEAWGKTLDDREQALRVVNSARFGPRATLPEWRPRIGWRHVDASGVFSLDVPEEMHRRWAAGDSYVGRYESPRLRLEWDFGAGHGGGDPRRQGYFLLDGHPAQLQVGRDSEGRSGLPFFAQLDVGQLSFLPDLNPWEVSAGLSVSVFARSARDQALAVEILRTVHVPPAQPTVSASR